MLCIKISDKCFGTPVKHKYNYRSARSSAFGTDMCVVKELVEKTGVLIEDERLRRKMGVAGRREIETSRARTLMPKTFEIPIF